MANFRIQLLTLFTSLLFDIYGIDGQPNATNASNTSSPTSEPTQEPTSEPTLEPSYTTSLQSTTALAQTTSSELNIIVIGGAAAITLMLCLCITLTIFCIYNMHQKSKKKQNKKQPHPYANRQHIGRAQSDNTFSKKQLRQMHRMASVQEHPNDTNFTDPRHVSAYQALQFCPPINHNGDQWKQLDHSNPQQRMFQLMQQQEYLQQMANQTAMAMDYFYNQHVQILQQQQHQHHLSGNNSFNNDNSFMSGHKQKLASYSSNEPIYTMNSVKSRNSARSGHSGHSGHSGYSSNMHLMPSPVVSGAGEAPIGAIDSDDQAIADSGELPDSIASGQNALQLQAEDFQFNKYKGEDDALNENAQVQMQQMGNVPVLKTPPGEHQYNEPNNQKKNVSVRSMRKRFEK